MTISGFFRSALCAAAIAALAAILPARAQDALAWLDQGSEWSRVRGDFYTQDQGSRMIPLAWMKALRRPGDGAPFLEDGLTRYGYLPNPDSREGLPVGFHASGSAGAKVVGMTCAACHTRQITVGDNAYRIDGGPALADFQSLLEDLDVAAAAAAASDAAFDAFARAALGEESTSAERQALRVEFDGWRTRYHTLIANALKGVDWGHGRLDAVSMIFNRLTGLDLGKPPSRIIAANILPASAPARYPFLWNAGRQDKTQWPGFADNGSEILGLPRNLGEVFGVFGIFEPAKAPWRLLGIEYLSNNSANFDGLGKLEEWMNLIEAPRWQWGVDEALAARGEDIFNTTGECAKCHARRDGQVQFPNVLTWATPVVDVGTDGREYAILMRKADPGVLTGARIPTLVKPLKNPSYAVDILAVSVLGSILQNVARTSSDSSAALAARLTGLPPSLKGLIGAIASAEHIRNLSKGFGTPAAKYPYEARVLYGVWAAAPYLHNGSVATLEDLLKPASQRKASFKVGPAYDLEKVGLAEDQPEGSSTLVTTDCSDRVSGNSRCGHEYGTRLSDDDRKALLEYLKTL